MESTSAPSLANSIRNKITTAIPNLAKLIVREEGSGCAGSFTVVVVSESFEGVGPLNRQRQINAIIAQEIAALHSIVLKTWTPSQWENQKAAFDDDK
jgi:stress-induced morphogen